MLLLTTFDLDRPTRGLIRVPDTPLVTLRAEMELPPAASGRDGRGPVPRGRVAWWCEPVATTASRVIDCRLDLRIA
jgi:hypothetical protein